MCFTTFLYFFEKKKILNLPKFYNQKDSHWKKALQRYSNKKKNVIVIQKPHDLQLCINCATLRRQ